MRNIMLVLLVLLSAGCASTGSMVPPSWKEPILPVVSKPFEVEKPWETQAIRNIEARSVRVSMPERWLRSQFPVKMVRDVRSKVKEEKPARRLASRAMLFCRDMWIRVSAVAADVDYAAQVSDICTAGDRLYILSGSGKHVLTLDGRVVLDPGTEKIFTDERAREAFFAAYPSVLREVGSADVFTEMIQAEGMTQVIGTDEGSYRVTEEVYLAAAHIAGATREERFHLCGGADVSLVGAILAPATAAIGPAIGLGCALFGSPTGFFLPDNDYLAKASEGKEE